MDFSVELTAFPSAVHSQVYAHARGLTPLERSLSAASGPDMRASCAACHGFMTGMLSDMYDNPEEYALPVMALEEFCGGVTVNGMKRRSPSKTKDILSQTRNVVHGYIALLCMLGKAGVLDGDTLGVSESDLAVMDQQVSTARSPISLAKRLKALSRVGLTSDSGQFISTRYPGMFPAICALAKKCEKLSGFAFFAFGNADFRPLGAKYKPTYEDYYAPLISEQREQAESLHDFALQNNMSPAIGTFWKVDYKYKGAQVMCVGSMGDCERLLDVRIIGAYNWDDPALINGRLEREPREFQKQALRHIWRCDACSTSHLGMFVTVLGKRQRVCGGGMIAFRWRNPAGGDLEILKRLIQMRCEIIDEIRRK
ncbi:MAG: hypothetical protein LBH95_08760 [Oscillospiraceae bacterium]|jgi:hypothetical protein|nr:hypothetical protein [Oscillospiraceae bacterium]